jgi:hypothetical protein
MGLISKRLGHCAKGQIITDANICVTIAKCQGYVICMDPVLGTLKARAEYVMGARTKCQEGFRIRIHQSHVARSREFVCVRQSHGQGSIREYDWTAS